MLNALPSPHASSAPEPVHHRVLHRVQASRMGGTMPVWSESVSALDTIGREIARAENTAQSQGNPQSARAYAASADAAGHAGSQADNGEEDFNFSDLLDIVNPLQHIPLVSHAYRAITGDTIKGPGRVIGGAVFGGFAGAASGLVNLIVEQETGKDIAGNIVAAVTGDKSEPKNRMAKALATPPDTQALLSFADPAYLPEVSIARQTADDEAQRSGPPQSWTL